MPFQKDPDNCQQSRRHTMMEFMLYFLMITKVYFLKAMPLFSVQGMLQN